MLDNDVKVFVDDFFSGKEVTVVDVSGFGGFYESGIWTLISLGLGEMVNEDGLYDDYISETQEQKQGIAEQTLDRMLRDDRGNIYSLGEISGAAYGAALNVFMLILNQGSIQKAFVKAPEDRFIKIRCGNE